MGNYRRFTIIVVFDYVYSLRSDRLCVRMSFQAIGDCLYCTPFRKQTFGACVAELAEPRGEIKLCGGKWRKSSGNGR